MSSNLAYSLPSASLPTASPREREHPRQIEIVTTRSQRRARPRIAYALIAVGGVFAIFIAQLLLSIALSNGAYQLASLTSRQTELGRTQSALNEKLDLAGSTQNLAANAQKLGMVGTSAPAFLRLSDGTVMGTAVVASAAGETPGVIANSLLTGAPLSGASATTGATAGASATPGTTGTTATTGTTGTTASGAAASKPSGAGTESGNAAAGSTGTAAAGALPSPVTH
jgi:hypothetical protein